jgi:type IV pilus assembly protein PilY1
MLHAFAGDFSLPTTTNPLTGGGSELFAYVPSLLFNGPSSPATPSIDGLAALANLNGVTTNVYNHHFYVDETPVAADVDFDWTCPTAGTACAAGSLPNWHTVLAGSLGKGGKGIYALNITTTPAAVAQTTGTTLETTIASQLMWEFTDSDMGFTYGKPVFAKTRKYGWVVLITSGYNNSSGHGHLYVLNAQTGTLLEELTTPDTGSSSNPSGLGRASAYTQDLTDGTIEQVYAGDLLGNVWRFDLSASSGAYPTPTLFAQLTDPSGNSQPITTAPAVELDINNTGLDTRRWVFVGTGKFLATSDLTNNQQQTMYALRDGTGSTPSAATSPLKRAALIKTDLLTTQPLSDSASGWYYDLPGKAPVTGGATERIVVDPDAVAGSFVVAWTTMIPTADPCSYHGGIYAAGFGSALTALTGSGGGALVSATTTSGAPTGVEIVQTPGSSSYSILVPSTSVKEPPMIQTLTGGISNSALYRTNWREIFN